MDNVHRTRLRVVVLAGIVAMLLLATLAQAQVPAQYSVESGTAAGGNYYLSTLTWQSCGKVSGGGYSLSAPAAAAGIGSGCCCTFLPVSVRP